MEVTERERHSPMITFQGCEPMTVERDTVSHVSLVNSTNTKPTDAFEVWINLSKLWRKMRDCVWVCVCLRKEKKGGSESHFKLEHSGSFVSVSSILKHIIHSRMASCLHCPPHTHLCWFTKSAERQPGSLTHDHTPESRPNRALSIMWKVYCCSRLDQHPATPPRFIRNSFTILGKLMVSQRHIGKAYSHLILYFVQITNSQHVMKYVSTSDRKSVV